MNYKLLLIILTDLAFLLYGVTTISISAQEATIFFEHRDFLHYLIVGFTKLFGQNDFALRIPFILFHVGGVLLLYKVSGYYLKKEQDRLFSIVIFMFLPGVLSSSLIVNSSSITVFFTLLFIYLYEEKKTVLAYILLVSLIMIDNSFEVLYLGVFAYAVYHHDRKLYYLSALLFISSLYLYGFDSGGRPRGYFLDTLAMYALVFSPLLFLYYFYTMYRIFFKGKKTLLWFISSVAFFLSILFSFRQRIPLSDFAPYAVIALPIVVDYFFKSLRVRLSQYQRPYKISLFITIVLLVINFLFTYFNKYLYLVLDDPSMHFAKKFHIAKELAQKLKEDKVNHIKCKDKDLCKRLKFYGISNGDEFYIETGKNTNSFKKVTISYKSVPIITYSVSKLHN